MNNAYNNPSELELQREFAKRAYDGYTNGAHEFNKTFSILLAFSLIFLLLIQLPYTLIKSQRVALDQKLEDAKRSALDIDEKLKLYSKARSGIDNLHSVMREGPYNLRRKIQELSELRNGEQSQMLFYQQQQQQQQQISCGVVGSERWLSCEVEHTLITQFETFKKTLNGDVFKPLQNLAAAGEGIETQNVQNGLNSLQEKFWDILRENKQFWLTFSGKEEFFDQLDKEVSNFWNTYGADIDKKAAQLKKDVKRLEAESAELQNIKDQLIKSAADIKTRISSIESPFGKLPVGMAESIALYPLIIAFGFAIAAIKMISTMKLRAEVFRIWRQQDPQKNVLSDEQISLIVPLALAPTAGGRMSFGKISLLLLPLAIYILACALILYSWWEASIIEDDLLSGLKPIYGLLYVTSAIFMVVSYSKILTIIRQLSEK